MDLSKQFMVSEPGYALERINQAQLGMAAGVGGLLNLEKLGRNRPDAWGQSSSQNSVYGECDNDRGNSERHAETICTNDPSGIVYLAVMP
jgi:hypothetical protein